MIARLLRRLRAAARPAQDSATVPEDLCLVTFALPDGRPYTLSIGTDTGDAHRDWIAATGAQDPDWRLCMALLRPDDVFLDLGAHFGAFSIPAAVAGARVHAFELLATNVRRLEEALARNPGASVRVTHGAVSDRPGTVEFSGTSAWGVVRPGSGRHVAALRVDDYVARHGIDRVDVLKVDVEGSERAALLGVADTIRRHQPDVVIECNSFTCGTAGYSYRALLRLLSGWGYALHRIGHGTLFPWPDEVPQEMVVCDYLATVRTPEQVTARTAWAVRPMTDDERAANILQQAGAGDHHRMHLLAVWDRLPPATRQLPEVAALLPALRPLGAAPDMSALVTGTA